MTGRWRIDLPHIVLILCRFLVVVVIILSTKTAEAQVCTYDIDDQGKSYWWDRTNDHPSHKFADNNRWLRQYSIYGAAERRMYQTIGSLLGYDLFISATWECYNKARQGPYTFILRKHAAIGKYECVKMYVNPNRQLLVERIAKPGTVVIPTDAPAFSSKYPDCSNPNIQYPSIAQVLVKEPINSTGKICPFESRLYNVTIHSGDKRELCKEDPDSRVTITDQRFMIFQSCLQGNSYEEPFNGKIECVGTILPDAIASRKVDGEVLILSFLPAFQSREKRYYVTRYMVSTKGDVQISMMARKTTVNNIIYTNPSQRYDTVESTNETVTFALEMHPLPDEMTTSGTSPQTSAMTTEAKEVTKEVTEVSTEAIEMTTEAKEVTKEAIEMTTEAKFANVDKGQTPSEKILCGYMHCDITCVNGYEQGSNGCNTCQCKQTEWNKQCPRGACNGNGLCTPSATGYSCSCYSNTYGVNCQDYHLPELILYQISEIYKKTDKFEAGKPVTAECRIRDAIPDELILDFKHNDHYTACVLELSQNRGVQCSAEIIPKKSDNKAGLWQCRATYRGHEILSIGKEVSVLFPTERVSLSSAGARKVTTPGSNVFLSCKTDSANPAAKLKWQNNGVYINDSSSVFIILDSLQEGDNNGFVSVSKLSFVANDELAGSVFHCVAIHQYRTVKSNGFFLLSDVEDSKKGSVLAPARTRFGTPGIIGLCIGLFIFILIILITISLVQRLNKHPGIKLVKQRNV